MVRGVLDDGANFLQKFHIFRPRGDAKKWLTIVRPGCGEIDPGRIKAKACTGDQRNLLAFRFADCPSDEGLGGVNGCFLIFVPKCHEASVKRIVFGPWIGWVGRGAGVDDSRERRSTSRGDERF